jgi:SAM-dependent methyltransferase
MDSYRTQVVYSFNDWAISGGCGGTHRHAVRLREMSATLTFWEDSMHEPHKHEAHAHHRFHGNIERLREPQRLALMEVDRVVASCLEGIQAGMMLDIGVGSGVFAEAFAAHGVQVSGIDVNPEMVQVAQRYVPGGRFQVAAAEALPFTDNAFDLVFLSQVLHEADDIHQMLIEAKRVARTRVAILEWPYQQDEMGPPLSIRIKPDTFAAIFKEAGFQQYELVPLKHMTLYRLSPSA